MSRQLLSVCFFVGLMVCSYGCDSNVISDSSQKAPEYVIHVDMDDAGGTAVTLPDGMFYSNLLEIETSFKDLVSQGFELQFEFGDNMSKQLDQDLEDYAFVQQGTSSSNDDAQGNLQVKVAPLYIGYNYNMTSGFGYKYVAGCLKRNAYRLAVRLNHYSNLVFDMHAAFYRKDGRVCFGLYESASKWTKCFCSPTYSQIKQAVVDAALVVGISYGVAVIVANIVTPMIMTMAVL